jgi:hypothetical protein
LKAEHISEEAFEGFKIIGIKAYLMAAAHGIGALGRNTLDLHIIQAASFKLFYIVFYRIMQEIEDNTTQQQPINV